MLEPYGVFFVCMIAPESCADLAADLAALSLSEECQGATSEVLVLQCIAFSSDAAACPCWEVLLPDEGQNVPVAFGIGYYQDGVAELRPAKTVKVWGGDRYGDFAGLVAPVGTHLPHG